MYLSKGTYTLPYTFTNININHHKSTCAFIDTFSLNAPVPFLALSLYIHMTYVLYTLYCVTLHYSTTLRVDYYYDYYYYDGDDDHHHHHNHDDDYYYCYHLYTCIMCIDSFPINKVWHSWKFPFLHVAPILMGIQPTKNAPER